MPTENSKLSADSQKNDLDVEKLQEDAEFDSNAQVEDETNENNFKTHYFIKPKLNKRPLETSPAIDSFPQYNPALSQKKRKLDGVPFFPLFDGKEPYENVRFRYQLYETIWEHQLQKIQLILNNANDNLVQDVTRFIKDLFSNDRLPIGYIQMTSNTANNLRILEQLQDAIQYEDTIDEGTDDFSEEENGTTLIVLNTKNSPHIKGALKEINAQFEDIHGGLDYSERLSYDLQVIADWYEINRNSTNTEEEEEEEEEENVDGQDEQDRLVVMIEDTNLFNTQLLSQVIRMLQALHRKVHVRLLLALSCDTVSSWVSNNFPNDLRAGLNGYKFKSNDNVSLGYTILNNLFLTPDLNEYNPFLINSNLSTIILNRFQHSNNSIDALIAELKLCYMIHFYRLPLSILIAQVPKESMELYIDGLRKLPSYKQYIEQNILNLDSLKFDAVRKDETVLRLFNDSKGQFKTHKLVMMNVINVIYNLDTKKRKEKFEIYKSLVKGELLTSKYFHDCLNSANTGLSLLSNITSNCIEELDGVKDLHLVELNKSLAELAANGSNELISTLQTYFKNQLLTKSFEKILFNEIFTLDGGVVHEKFERAPLLEENFENLMINCLRPNLRQTIESALDNPEIYLKSVLTNSIDPLLRQMFKVYKEAPASINLHDFYQAFCASLTRPSSIKDDKEWAKVAYSWFLQCCFELMHLGIVQTKKTGEYLEKAIWKGV